VKLHDRIQRLAGEPRYERFFAETADEFAELNRRVAAFLRRSDASLTISARLRTLETQVAYEELTHERREAFAEGCRDIFRELALFLARAVPRSEASEKDIVYRLREAGFAATEPMNFPDFPIDSLTLLALCVFLYLAAVGVIFAHMPGVPQQSEGGLVMSAKIALVRLVAVGVTVWLMQRIAFFRRQRGDPPRFFAYVLCGVIASAVAVGVCLFFDLSNSDLLGVVHRDLPLVLLSGVLCAAIAFCCDDWVEDTAPPVWLRFAEAACCGAVVAMGALLVYYGDLLPMPTTDWPRWMLAAWIVLPSVLAMVIGGCVPHIYRSARRAANARRVEASRTTSVPGDESRHLPVSIPSAPSVVPEVPPRGVLAA
jgi:type IV secretory pathway TrbD component